MVPAANTCSPAGSTHGLREANKQQCHCGRAPGLPRLFTLTVLEPEQAQSPVQKPSFRSPDFGGWEDQLRALEQAGSSAARPNLNTDYDVSSSQGGKTQTTHDLLQVRYGEGQGDGDKQENSFLPV